MRIDTIAIEASALAAGTGLPALLWALLGLAAVLLLAGAAVWLRRARSVPPDVSEEACAVIIAVLCEELRCAPEELRITSIRRL